MGRTCRCRILRKKKRDCRRWLRVVMAFFSPLRGSPNLDSTQKNNLNGIIKQNNFLTHRIQFTKGSRLQLYVQLKAIREATLSDEGGRPWNSGEGQFAAFDGWKAFFTFCDSAEGSTWAFRPFRPLWKWLKWKCFSGFSYERFSST